MLTEIKLTNFKCFKEETAIPLSKFNLFTGVNGAGKSTALQSLLLMRQSIEHNPYTTELILNGSCVNLGSFDDVRNREIAKSESISFEFFVNAVSETAIFSGSIIYNLNFINDMNLHIKDIIIKQENIDLCKQESFSAMKEIYHDIRLYLRYSYGNFYNYQEPQTSYEFRLVKLSPLTKIVFPMKTLLEDPNEYTLFKDKNIDSVQTRTIENPDNPFLTFNSEFDYDNLNFERIHFISADRIGPQEYYQKSMLQQFRCVGTKGEFAVNLLDKLAQELVNETLCLGDDARTLITQTQAWLGKILNPVTIRINPLRVNILELLIDGFKPSNVGFGYSSILPIIVTGLIAKPNEKIIIENPEIHLHPKAQSALIEFLVKVANTGVQIFIESHSDHIINGILVQCKKFEESSENGISKDDVSLLYFDSDETGKNGRTTKINIEENGRIRYTPKGFFDQFTIDRKFLMGF